MPALAQYLGAEWLAVQPPSEIPLVVREVPCGGGKIGIGMVFATAHLIWIEVKKDSPESRCGQVLDYANALTCYGEIESRCLVFLSRPNVSISNEEEVTRVLGSRFRRCTWQELGMLIERWLPRVHPGSASTFEIEFVRFLGEGRLYTEKFQGESSSIEDAARTRRTLRTVVSGVAQALRPEEEESIDLLEFGEGGSRRRRNFWVEDESPGDPAFSQCWLFPDPATLPGSEGILFEWNFRKRSAGPHTGEWCFAVGLSRYEGCSIERWSDLEATLSSLPANPFQAYEDEDDSGSTAGSH